MSASALSLMETSFLRGGRPVVDGVTLTLKPGEWMALVGPNGAGKSTVLNLASGLLTPIQGDIVLSGKPLQHWRSRERARHLGWLGQSPDGDEDMIVQDVVELGRLPHRGWLSWGTRRSLEQDSEAVMMAMQRADVVHLAAKRLGCLSGGERQRVHLARVLAGQSSVMLLDEPLAHLDAPHQRGVIEVIRRVVHEGGAVLSVLHELPWALVADRVAVMAHGRLLAVGPPGDSSVHEALLHVFDHAVVLTQVDGRWTAWPRL